MIAENINNVKKFMSELLIGDKLNDFLTLDVTITTYNTFHIDGHIKKDFYEKDDYDALGSPGISTWSTLKPLCYEIIKGKRTPLNFKIIFGLSGEKIQDLIDKSGTDLKINDVNGLFINIKYEKGFLQYVTGTSLAIFTMNKDLEKEFDKYVSTFISTLF